MKIFLKPSPLPSILKTVSNAWITGPITFISQILIYRTNFCSDKSLPANAVPFGRAMWDQWDNWQKDLNEIKIRTIGPNSKSPASSNEPSFILLKSSKTGSFTCFKANCVYGKGISTDVSERLLSVRYTCDILGGCLLGVS